MSRRNLLLATAAAIAIAGALYFQRASGEARVRFILIVCVDRGTIQCDEVPISATDERTGRREWCAKTDDARRHGGLFNAVAVGIDARWPRSRQLIEWWCP